jgi:hypothetical protein
MLLPALVTPTGLTVSMPIHGQYLITEAIKHANIVDLAMMFELSASYRSAAGMHGP